MSEYRIGFGSTELRPIRTLKGRLIAHVWFSRRAGLWTGRLIGSNRLLGWHATESMAIAKAYDAHGVSDLL